MKWRNERSLNGGSEMAKSSAQRKGKRWHNKWQRRWLSWLVMANVINEIFRYPEINEECVAATAMYRYLVILNL